MTDLTTIAKARCNGCGYIVNIPKCFPDWGRDWETGDTCPVCKKGMLVVTPIERIDE